jgi:hypothetical protein
MAVPVPARWGAALCHASADGRAPLDSPVHPDGDWAAGPGAAPGRAGVQAQACPAGERRAGQAPAWLETVKVAQPDRDAAAQRVSSPAGLPRSGAKDDRPAARPGRPAAVAAMADWDAAAAEDAVSAHRAESDCAASLHTGAAGADRRESFPDAVRMACPRAVPRAEHSALAAAPAGAERSALADAARHAPERTEPARMGADEATLR